MKLSNYYQMKVNGKFQDLKKFCNICNMDSRMRIIEFCEIGKHKNKLTEVCPPAKLLF